MQKMGSSEIGALLTDTRIGVQRHTFGPASNFREVKHLLAHQEGDLMYLRIALLTDRKRSLEL